MMEVITNSRINRFKNCRRKAYYRDVKRLVPRIKSEALSMGSAVHKGLETGRVEDALTEFDGIYPNDQKEADKLEINKTIVRAILEGYFDYYGDWDGKFMSEMEFDIPIINPATDAKSRTFRLGGKVDGLLETEEGNWLVEYKTAGSVNKTYVERLALDTQVTTYIYGVQRQLGITIDGIIYRILRKPSIRQRKDETLLQYRDRLIQDYKDRPEFYFYGESLYRSQEDIIEFERELWSITQDMLKCRREGLWYKNTSRCSEWGGCEYMPLCLQEEDAEILFETREINPELEGAA